MTNAEKEKQRRGKPEGMVLYRCPYCGEMHLKALFEITYDDIWECLFCKQTMKMA